MPSLITENPKARLARQAGKTKKYYTEVTFSKL